MPAFRKRRAAPELGPGVGSLLRGAQYEITATARAGSRQIRLSGDLDGRRWRLAHQADEIGQLGPSTSWMGLPAAKSCASRVKCPEVTMMTEAAFCAVITPNISRTMLTPTLFDRHCLH